MIPYTAIDLVASLRREIGVSASGRESADPAPTIVWHRLRRLVRTVSSPPRSNSQRRLA